MNLYTIILDFRAGTYIYQQTAPTPKEAVLKWLNTLNTKDIQYFGNKSKTELQNNTADLFEFLNGIETVQNVWHLTYSLPTGFLDIHIIKTAV